MSQKTSGAWLRGPLALLVACLGCVDPPARQATLELSAHTSAGHVDRWVFAGGARLDELEVPGEALVPGELFAVAFRVSEPGRYELRVAPPRAAAREVALGGPGAPPVDVPPDGRSNSVVVQGSGRLNAELLLADPWHPRTAILTVRRLGSVRFVPTVEGPRRRDGTAVLAVLDVERRPTAVVAHAGTASVDGVLDDPVWRDATRTTLVHSMDGEPVRLGARREDTPDWGPTEVAFAWDSDALFVAAWLPDHDIRGTFTADDQPIWKEEVFELFVFGDARRADYLELQVSPRGVRFDSRFGRYRQGDTRWTSGFSAPVQVRGTIEEPRDRDEGWTTELSVPWSEICAHTEVSCPVSPGTSLRVNTFRLERPRDGSTVGLALSPTGVPDFHAPENSARLTLATRAPK